MRRKIAIVYCSTHGTTGKIARHLADQLKNDEVEIFDLKEDPQPEIRPFEIIIIGGSMHYGTIQKEVVDFYSANMDFLLQRDTGLFACGMLMERKEEEFENAFPEKLRNHSISKGFFGGEFLFNKMNFFERLIVKKMAKTKESISRIDHPAINNFLAGINGESGSSGIK